MKKVLLVAVMALGISQVNAQNYKNALGVVVDLGDGETLVGPQFKHSFDGKMRVTYKLCLEITLLF
ncbi:hypothetical protein [Empedobacter falsenii]